MKKTHYFHFVYFCHHPYERRHLWIDLPFAVRKAELICCGPSLRLKSTKQILMMYEERGGIVRIYSSGVKMTLKARKAPMETTSKLPRFVNIRQHFASKKQLLNFKLTLDPQESV